jgi:hypothetical protein
MSDEPNEILEAAKAAKAHKSAGADKAKASDKARRWQLGKYVGVGIGSAAVAAALLFANGKKR